MSDKYQLKNGMDVILVPNHKSPVVSVQMWVRTGSADEKKAEEGISHFIEHLVFKGTKKFKVGEIAAAVEGAGGELNAYTSFDQTVFYVTISKQFVSTAFEVISEMMGFPEFDPQEIDNEREVVIEEIKRSHDSLGRQSSQLLFSSSYKKHPYGIPVIGYEKVVKKVKPEKIKSYFQSRYVPKNMFLVVAGDFDKKEIKKDISSYFSIFPERKLEKRSREKEEKQEKPKIQVKESPFKESQFYFAWKIPSAKHKDIPGLDILSLILGYGESSRLVKKLRVEKPLVNSVGVSSFTPMDAGLFVVSATLNIESLDEVLDEICLEITKVLAEAPQVNEVKKAVLALESEEFYSLETVEGLARKAGHLEFLMKDPKYFKKYLKQVREVQPNDLVKLARKYLKPEKVIITAMSPSDPNELKKKFKSWVKDYSKGFVEAKKKKIQEGKKLRHSKINFKLTDEDATLKKVKLDNGVTMLLRKSSDTAIVSARAAFLGGIRAEREDISGVTELFSRTWVSDTASRSEKEIHKEIEEMAGSLHAFSGRNSVGLSVEMLAPFENQGRELFFDVLDNSSFSKNVLDRERMIMREQIKSRNDNPAQLAIRQFSKKMYKSHPYGKDLLGEEEGLDKISREDILDYWSPLARTENLFVVVSGNLNEKDWINRFENLPNGQIHRGEMWKKQFSENPIDQEERAYSSLEKEQSHIVYGFLGLRITDSERYTIEVIQSILAGQGGRLFVELRDKNSLAYTVMPLRMEGIDQGYFAAYIGCSPEKSEKSIRMLKEQFDLLTNQKVDSLELERAKRYLIGRHDIDLQRNSAIANAILFNDIYGNPYDEAFHFAEKVKNVTSEEVLSLSQKIFSQPSVMSLVGPTCPW